VRNEESYLDMLGVRSASTQKSQRIAIKSFKTFTKVSIEKTISEIKDSEEKVFDVLQKWISWNFKRGVNPASIKVYFGYLNQLFYFMGIKLSPMDIKMNLRFPKKEKEELHAPDLEEIRKLFNAMSYWKRALHIAKASSGMRINEIVNIRKKDLDLSKKRIMVRIPAKYTKTKQSRTVIISSEAGKMIMPRVMKLNDNDRVWSNFSAHAEGQYFRKKVDKVGLGMRYETTNRRKINTHLLRSFFITKVSRYDRDLALILAGQGSKATELEYDRLSPDEKLDMYIQIEPELIIDSTARDKIALEKKDQEITELKKSKLEIQKLQRKQEETSVRLAEINEKIFSDFDKQKKPMTDSDMELVANVIRSRMELDPEFSNSFKKMVNENPKISIEKKKGIGAI